MAQARLYLLGAPRLEVGARPVELDTRKALALLAYVALGEAKPGSGYTRDALAALLYPESDQTSARAALRRTISPLRKALDENSLETGREQIRVRLDGLWVDVLAFRLALAQTRQHGHAHDSVCPACLPPLEEAVSLYQGGFMAGFSLRDSSTFDDWQFFQAEALRRELGEALEKLSSGLAACADFKAAASQARRWLELDRLNEAAHRQLMLIFAWDNQRNAALRQYRECVKILDQELGVSPLDETAQLYQAILENHIPSVPPMAADPRAGGAAVPTAVPTPDQPTEQTLPHAQRKAGYPLAGRVNELKAIQQAYTDAARHPNRRGFLFVVEGEAGIGKTRLAEEFLAGTAQQYASNRPVEVLAARCYESETGLAYAPFINALNEAIARPGSSGRLGGLSPVHLSLAAQLAPALGDLFHDLPAPPAPQSPGAQVRFLEALRMAIQALAAPESESDPLGIIFLDDLQWLDQASLGVLDYITRRLDGVFVLAAWRSDLVAADHPLRHLAAQAGLEGRAASLSLPRLRMQDVADMASGAPIRLTQEQVRHLYQETEGNPFFVAAYLESQSAAPSGQADFSGREMPHSVRSLLLNRFASVSELGRQVLSAASVLGRSFDFAILREVSGRSELETITALEELLQRSLIWEHSPVDLSATLAYDFSHDKLREAAYEETSLARRRLLHGRAAEVLAGRARGQREAAALTAFHYRLAGQYPQAAQWFQTAGENDRAIYANQDAISHLQSALACGHPEPAVLHEAIGDISLLSGQYSAALTSYEAAAASCAPQHLPWIEHKLGNVHNQLGSFDLAECYLKAALDELESAPVTPEAALAERAMILADWSHSVYRRGETAEALELALQSVELAQSSQDGQAQAQTHNNLGILQRVNGQFNEAIQNLQKSLEIAEKMGESGPRAAALNNLARVYAETSQLERAISFTRQALEISEQRGDRHRAAALLNNLADLFHAAGQEEESMMYLRKAVVIFAEIGVDPAMTPDAEIPDSNARLFPEIWKLSEW